MAQQARQCGIPVSEKKKLFAVVIVFLTTGTANTLFAKWADTIHARGTNPTVSHLFDHPFYQTNLMFMGEMFCLFAFEALLYFNKRNNNTIRNEHLESANSTPLVWVIPAVCDLLASSMVYIGLQLTSASSFQMIRGSVILFTGLLARLILNTKLRIHQWIGMVTIVIGLITVGCGDYLYHNEASIDNTKWHAVIGDALIIVSQLLTAFQLVVEEKFLKKFKVDPLKAVGWEGLFGFIIMFVAFMPLYYIPWHIPIASNRVQQTTVRFEDVNDAVAQMLSSSHLLIACIGVVLSIALFNFAGLTLTRKWNAASRIVLDSIRTIFIWAISLILPNWQVLQPFQPIGYLILVIGTFLYYGIIFMPSIRWVIRKCIPNDRIQREEQRQLLEQPINASRVNEDSSKSSDDPTKSSERSSDGQDDRNQLYAPALRM